MKTPYDLSEVRNNCGDDFRITLLASSVQTLKTTVADQEKRIKLLEDIVYRLTMTQ